MKKINRALLLILATILFNTYSVKAQWETKTPAEQTMADIQTEYTLPSEKSRDELRARPTDETPIGGINASIPEASLLSFLMVLGVYQIIRLKGMRHKKLIIRK